MKIDFDNKVLQMLSSAFDYLMLAALWMLCSLPIVTLGASTAALFSATLGVSAQTGGAAKRFFRAFRDNFRLSTLVWLVFIVLGIVLAADVYIIVKADLTEAVGLVLRAATVMAALVFTCCISLAFGIIARFTVNFRQVFFNVLILTVGNPGWVVLLMLLSLLLPVCFAGLMALGFVPASIVFYAQSLILKRILCKYIPSEPSESECEK